MIEFKIKASDTNGRILERKLFAQDKLELLSQLKNQNLTAISIEMSESEKKTSRKDTARKLKRAQVLRFTKQLRTLLKAGIPMVQGLSILGKQTEEPALAGVIDRLVNIINQGKTLSAALTEFPESFPNFYINSVKVGEKSGNLDEALLYIHQYLVEESELKKKLTTAVRYPTIVFLAIIGAFIVFTTLVIPNFIPIFEMSGTELPMPTKFLIGLNHFITNYWLVFLIGIATIVFSVIALKRHPQGRYWWDLFWLKFPLIGQLIEKINVAKFAKIYYTLNRSGIPAREAFEILQDTMENSVIHKELSVVGRSIRQGNGVAKSLSESIYFSGFIVEMITIGENSGALDEMLETINEQYDNEVADSLDKLIASIEPMTTIVIGAMVVFLAMAMFLPLWDTINLAG